MTTATTIDQAIPAGTWTVDPLHSNASFEVEHAGVSIFRGGFKPIDARLEAGDDGTSLTGAVRVETISVDDENIRPHLLSPEFFDAERNPEIRFTSTEIVRRAPGELRLGGELSLAGASLPVEATGRLRGPVAAPGGGEKIALALEASIDRTAYGMDWQMETPDGGSMLANDVKLVVELELNRG